MKFLRPLALGLAVLAASSAFGTTVSPPAMLHIVRSAAFPSVHSVYLDGGVYNGAFDVVTFQARAESPSSLRNLNSGFVAGVPRPAGAPFTYFNRLLDADPAEFSHGLGWTLIGITRNALELSYTAGSLFEPIDTASQPDNRVFLANLDVTPGGTASVRVQLIDGRSGVGVMRTELTAVVPIPEPSAVGLMGMGVALVAARWRNGRPQRGSRAMSFRP
jgi:hypothetical protein